MRGLVHHIDLSVQGLERSRVFYECVLGFMGYKPGYRSATQFDFDLSLPNGAFSSIGIKQSHGANAGRLHDRYAPGLHHLAWRAESPADVDAFYEYLKKNGVEILDPPAAYPQYGEGYYAVFFADPDGLKLEYVYKPS
jgi:catechol 2,3-dioxygenase-like lactoylglutathione lyase family enzyme